MSKFHGAKAGYEAAKVTPQFRSYSTKGDNKYTLAYAVENNLGLTRMGVENNNFLCETCKQNNKLCPGHFGHIKLAKPVFYMHYLSFF